MYGVTKTLLKSQWCTGTTYKSISIANMKLSQYDLTLLILIIDRYLKSLQLPTLYPEHLCEYRPVLERLRATFQEIVIAQRPVQLSLTVLDVIALDEAVEGFTRICERSKASRLGTYMALVKLDQFRQELVKMKVPHKQ
jgi:hypothetical protein